MKKEEPAITVKAVTKKTANKPTKAQQAQKKAMELPGAQASVAAELKNRGH